MECVVGQCLPTVLTTCFQEAEAALEARLAEVTVADVIDALRVEMAKIDARDLMTSTLT